MKLYFCNRFVLSFAIPALGTHKVATFFIRGYAVPQFHRTDRYCFIDRLCPIGAEISHCGDSPAFKVLIPLKDTLVHRIAFGRPHIIGIRLMSVVLSSP